MFNLLEREREDYQRKAKKATEASRLIGSFLKIKGIKKALSDVSNSDVGVRWTTITVSDQTLQFNLDNDEDVNSAVRALKPFMPAKFVKLPRIKKGYEYFYGYEMKGFGPNNSYKLLISHSWFDHEAAK